MYFASNQNSKSVANAVKQYLVTFCSLLRWKAYHRLLAASNRKQFQGGPYLVHTLVTEN